MRIELLLGAVWNPCILWTTRNIVFKLAHRPRNVHAIRFLFILLTDIAILTIRNALYNKIRPRGAPFWAPGKREVGWAFGLCIAQSALFGLWYQSGPSSGTNSGMNTGTNAYRKRYPGRVERPECSKNLHFYRNDLPMQPDNVRIDDALRDWDGDFGLLETGHGFIQWLFPIKEKGLNWEAQELYTHEIKGMLDDSVVKERIIKALRMMLRFYGMELVLEPQSFEPKLEGEWPCNMWPHFSTIEFRRLADTNLRNDRYLNLNTSFHNYLRITRILKFLGEVGLEEIKVEWVSFLTKEINEGRLTACRRSCQDFWVETIFDDQKRRDMEKALLGESVYGTCTVL